MSKTSFLEYLTLLKQVKAVPPEVKAVALSDLSEIKKSRIHIPDAVIRNSFNRRDKEIERDYEIKDDDYDTGYDQSNWDPSYKYQAKKWMEDAKKEEKQWSTQGTVGYFPSTSEPTEEISI